MASCPTEESYGYEDSRFERDVDENFHCSICYNVLKEPRMCGNNEHMFCLACISQHLNKNSETCPECNEHLSINTLRRPRVVNNCLSKLKIKCDYASRGCPQLTRLEELETHVANCGFAPVLCSNEGCGMEINRQEGIHHETAVCEYRKVKCHDCGHIQEVVGRLEGNLLELVEKVETVKQNIDESTEKMKGSFDEMKKDLKEVEEIKKEVKDVKEHLTKATKDVDEVKVMMRQMLEKLNMLELLNKLPSPTEGMLNTPREDILIAGGHRSSNTEIYSWEKNGWFKVASMNEKHNGASSFIYEKLLFVVGGTSCKTIETLNVNELPLKWTKYPGELPYRCDDHQTVVCQQRVIHIGGYSYDEGLGECSNMISELQLTPPCTLKKLYQMPEPRECHGAEGFEDKVLILGGRKSISFTDAMDSVLEFDVKKNEIKRMPPLPSALSKMVTVCWRDKVVVLGGRNSKSKFLNDVFMYNCKTGETTALPSMLLARCECCAVITGNTIVVMGGTDEKKHLNSVECFTMGGSTWEYLPAMNEARSRAVAEVLPNTRKYV